MFFTRSERNNKLTDEELIIRYRKLEEPEYVGQLFKRYAHLVYGICLKYLKREEDSKDALMNIFEKMMRDLKKHEIKHFKSWLYMVAKNHCLMKLRAKQKEVSRDLESIREEGEIRAIAGLFIPEAEERESEIRTLERAIDHLKEEQKSCIVLFYLKEMCYNEVAEKTGFSLKQVKSHIQNGKRNLKILLAKSHGNITT